MLNIKRILEAVLKDALENSDALIITDDQHFIDKLSGVEFHLMDDYFQMTRGDDQPVSVSSFTKDEQSIIMQLKELITDPAVTADKKENYQQHIKDNRIRLSGWFEQPIPITDGVQEEEDTEDYVR